MYCIDELKKEFGDGITGYFANPNIHPYDEFMRRKGSARRACEIKGIPLIINETYSFGPWASFPEQSVYSNRCEMCYTIRAELAAKKAAETDHGYFTSTLFISPYQDHELMKNVFEKAGRRFGVEFLYRDFRGGFREGQLQARESGLYRQKYCGCIKSLIGE